jgi:hypothetical protein
MTAEPGATSPVDYEQAGQYGHGTPGDAQCIR